MTTKTTEPRRYQCCHILTDGHRCGSPALTRIICYYHHTTRKPVPPAEIHARKGRRAEFTLPRPEDRSAIQHSIGEVLLRIAIHGIDARRAGLLLYGLQIASLNLPKPHPHADREDPVEEVLHHPEHGAIAPIAELYEASLPPSHAGRLLDEMDGIEDSNTTTLPTLQAACPTHDSPTAMRGVTLNPRNSNNQANLCQNRALSLS